MRVAFTTSGDSLQSAFEPCFNDALRVLVYDRSSRTFLVVPVRQNKDAGHENGMQAAQALNKNRIDALVTGHCESGEKQQLADEGVQVFELEATTVADALNQFNTLSHQSLELAGSTNS